MPTERGGGTGSRYTVLGRSDRQIQNFIFRALDGMQTRDTPAEGKDYMSIGGRGGVVCFIYDDNLQPCWIDRGVRSGGAGSTLYQYWVLDQSKRYARANKPRGRATRSLFSFYCPVEEEFSCLTRRLSSKLTMTGGRAA